MLIFQCIMCAIFIMQDCIRLSYLSLLNQYVAERIIVSHHKLYPPILPMANNKNNK